MCSRRLVQIKAEHVSKTGKTNVRRFLEILVRCSHRCPASVDRGRVPAISSRSPGGDGRRGILLLVMKPTREITFYIILFATILGVLLSIDFTRRYLKLFITPLGLAAIAVVIMEEKWRAADPPNRKRLEQIFFAVALGFIAGAAWISYLLKF